MMRAAYHTMRSMAVRTIAPLDCRVARTTMMSSARCSPEDKTLLRDVNISVERKDGMYVPLHAAHYLSVGLSAIHCIDRVLERARRQRAVTSVLDFACGNGRVLR